jgi:hypothetical protein
MAHWKVPKRSRERSASMGQKMLQGTWRISRRNPKQQMVPEMANIAAQSAESGAGHMKRQGC